MAETQRLTMWGWFGRAFAGAFGAMFGVVTALAVICVVCYAMVAAGAVALSSLGGVTINPVTANNPATTPWLSSTPECLIPAQPYETPAQAHQMPAQPYETPAQAYQTPAPPYGNPAQAYQTPAQPYQTPEYEARASYPTTPYQDPIPANFIEETEAQPTVNDSTTESEPVDDLQPQPAPFVE